MTWGTIIEVPYDKPVREPHGPVDRPSRTAIPPTPAPLPPVAPPIFRRTAYTFGVFASTSGASFGLGVEIQGGGFAEVDLESGMMTTGDFMTGGNSLSTGTRAAGASASIGVFGGVGTAQGFSGGATSVGASVTGPAGGLAAAYTESDADASGKPGYQGGSLAYTYSATGAGAEVTSTRSDTTLKARETFNINLEAHVRNWIGSQGMPSMFDDW